MVINMPYQKTVRCLQNLMPGDKSGISSILEQKTEGKKLKGMHICRLFCFLHVTISSTFTSRLPCES